MKRVTAFLSASLTLWLCAGVSATVLHVPGEYPTIQAGIDAASGGDTVLVADGTYTGNGNRDLDFGGVNMVVMSANGPEVTVIDCQHQGRGFYFHSGEDSSSVVRGFTVKNGSASDGGGIYCRSSSSPTIVGNAITGNAATSPYGGGGISCWEASSPTIAGSLITGNMSQSYGGGILCRDNSCPTITANTISQNIGPKSGGGIYCSDSSPTIEANTISENEAADPTAGGGGIECYGSSFPMIVDNTIVGNTADLGGGIECWFSSATIVGNRIAGNKAKHGGGIECYDPCSPTIANNTIVGNTASWIVSPDVGMGGGIACYWDSSPVIERNTIAWNRANAGGGGISHSNSGPTTIVGNTIAANRAGSYGGGGVYCYQSHADLINSILWGDSASAGWEIYLSSGGTVNVVYSDVEGGWEGEGNIDADPMFVLAEKGDCRLLWGSPAIDAGHPDSLDPDGTRSDMGAHFFDQDDYMTLYLTPDETEVVRGGVLGVTYTAINRWAQPEPFWVLTEAVLPSGNPFRVMGPDQYALPAETTVQRHLTHNVPGAAPLGKYGYGSKIGIPPTTLYDEDSFTFWVVQE